MEYTQTPADRRCLFYDAGCRSYQETLDFQLDLHSRCRAGEIPNALVFVEHVPPVMTFGARAKRENLLIPEPLLKQAGIELVQTDRGGDITYHGPGQLVGYPIINLKQNGNDVHRYLRLIEEVVIKTLADWDLIGRRNGLAGVWVDESKLCSIGIAVRGSVTYHGFALNVSPNLDHFGFINPCGLRSEQISSMERLTGRKIGMDEVKGRVRAHFSELFQLELDQTDIQL